MASSHQVKRFSWPRIWLFRRLLQQLFLWRLDIEKPEIVILGVGYLIGGKVYADVLEAFRARPECFRHGGRDEHAGAM